jgi:hypothetical protein
MNENDTIMYIGIFVIALVALVAIGIVRGNNGD